jgi:uncharacterized lipoprotein YddW (UPF0748 family)
MFNVKIGRATRLFEMKIAWALMLVFGGHAFVTTAAPGEVRGCWSSAWHPGFKSPQEVERLFGDLQGANFNAVFVQMRRRGDAFYESQLVPKTPGTRRWF